MFVEGRVLTTEGTPIPDAIIDTWEADANGKALYRILFYMTPNYFIWGFYDTQYADRSHPDCRGRLQSAEDGSFSFRAIVPPPYPIPGDVRLFMQLYFHTSWFLEKGPVGELLLVMGRHNMRPSHLHMVVQAPGFHKLITAFYPESCPYLQSDSVFGVKKSLVVVCTSISLMYFLTKMWCIATRSS